MIRVGVCRVVTSHNFFEKNNKTHEFRSRGTFHLSDSTSCWSAPHPPRISQSCHFFYVPRLPPTRAGNCVAELSRICAPFVYSPHCLQLHTASILFCDGCSLLWVSGCYPPGNPRCNVPDSVQFTWDGVYKIEWVSDHRLICGIHRWCFVNCSAIEHNAWLSVLIWHYDASNRLRCDEYFD
jgi:hypothetical protein